MKRVERREKATYIEQRNADFMSIMNELNKLISIDRAKGIESYITVNKIKDGASELFEKINNLQDLGQINHIQLWDDYYLRKDGAIILIENCEAEPDLIITLEEIENMKNNQIFKINQPT